MLEKVEALIDEIIRPLIQADGGQIEVIKVEENSIVLRLSGMCSGCPGQPYTTARIIEPVLKKALGESITIQYEH